MSPRAGVILTVGHGTQSAEEFCGLVSGAGIATVVDVRSYPGSRRHPHFARERMEHWLAEGGVAYRWERDLGGFRKARPDSRNVALRHDNFRGYADHMTDPSFGEALGRLESLSDSGQVAVMCSETLWWRCHRRLLADALVLWRGREVQHLLPTGRIEPHRLTDGVRSDPGGPPVYDVGVTGRL